MDSTSLRPEDVERALLAHVLADNSTLDALPMLQAGDFTLPTHGALFESMQDLRREGRPINVVTLAALTGADPLGGVDPVQSLRAVKFEENAPKPVHLAEAVLEGAIRRAIAAQGEWLAAQVGSLKVNPADIIAMQIGELDAILTRLSGRRKTSFTFAEGMDAAMARWQSEDDGAIINTGLASLDYVIGLTPGQLAILGGRPGMGKSALAAVMSTGSAVNGHGVLIFSQEMNLCDWMTRVASEATWKHGQGIEYKEAMRKRLSTDQLEILMRGARSRMQLPAVIDEAPNLTVSEIAARTRKTLADMARRGKKLDLVVVDHIGKVRSSKSYRDRRDLEVGEITKALAGLAKAENVGVLALCQVNRGVEERDNKRPGNADLRDSGRIEEDADAVMFAFREEYYLREKKFDAGSDDELVRLELLEKKKNRMEVVVTKCRSGVVGSVELFCDMSCNVIRDLDRRGA